MKKAEWWQAQLPKRKDPEGSTRKGGSARISNDRLDDFLERTKFLDDLFTSVPAEHIKQNNTGG